MIESKASIHKTFQCSTLLRMKFYCNIAHGTSLFTLSLNVKSLHSTKLKAFADDKIKHKLFISIFDRIENIGVGEKLLQTLEKKKRRENAANNHVLL